MNFHVPTKYPTKPVKKSKLIMTRYLNKAIRMIKAGGDKQKIMDNLFMAQFFAPHRFWWRASQVYDKWHCKY